MHPPIHDTRRRQNLQRRSLEAAPRRRVTDPSPRRRIDDQQEARTWPRIAAGAAAFTLMLTCVVEFPRIAPVADHVFARLGVTTWTAGTTVPAIAAFALPAGAMVLGLLALISQKRQTALLPTRKPPVDTSRDVISLARFLHIASARGIRTRVATQAYTLLLPHFTRSLRARLHDCLQDDLLLTETQVSNLVRHLLRDTDRRPRKGGFYDVSTVLDLLLAVQNSPRRYLPEIGLAFSGGTLGSAGRPHL